MVLARRPSRFARRLSLTVLLAALLAPLPAAATVVVPLSRAQLVERSDLVVRATVTDQRSTRSADRSQIVTLTRLRVQSYLKGSGPQEIVVRQLGGTVDGLTAHVAGDAELAPGGEYVLFLRRGTDVAFLTALAQAVYHVEHSADGTVQVRRDLHDLTFAIQNQGRMVLTPAPVETSETLEHLSAEITALAQGRR